MKYFIFSLLAMQAMGVYAFQLQKETFIDEYEETDQQRVGEDLARVTFADKDTYLTREGRDEERAIRNMPVVSGDFLKTFRNTYAEIEFIDGSLMQFSDRTEVEFQAINEIYDAESLSVVKLHAGSVFLHVTEEFHQTERRVFRVDTNSGSAYIEAPGIYRVDKVGSRMTLKVYRGFAELSGEANSADVFSGEYVSFKHMYQLESVKPFNSFQADHFESWAYDRRPVTDSISAKYVDDNISSYSADLDDSGEWRYEDDLNVHVWVPFVDASWRPYDSGYWAHYGPNLTWVSYDPFGWVTHHYGRWGWRVGIGWYWIPGRYYSPGWVAWTSYNGYVGWCPLGYWNRPYYYYQHRPNITIVNNHHYRWRYADARSIANGRRSYTRHNIRSDGPLRITTRRLYLNRDDLRDGSRITRVIRDPQLNRQRASSYRVARKPTLTTATAGRSGAERIKIDSRNAGTRAVSRRSPVTRPSSRATATDTETRSDVRRNSGDVRSSRSGVSSRTPRDSSSQRSQPAARSRSNSTQRSQPEARSRSNSTQRSQPEARSRSNSTQRSQPAARSRSNSTQRSQPAARSRSNSTQRSQPEARSRSNSTQQSKPAARSRSNSTQRSKPAARTRSAPPRQSKPAARSSSSSSSKPASRSSSRASSSSSSRSSSATRTPAKPPTSKTSRRPPSRDE